MIGLPSKKKKKDPTSTESSLFDLAEETAIEAGVELRPVEEIVEVKKKIEESKPEPSADWFMDELGEIE